MIAHPALAHPQTGHPPWKWEAQVQALALPQLEFLGEASNVSTTRQN